MMKSKVGLWSASSLCLALPGCGGGNSSAGLPVVPAPTPTATPAPSPTPTPTSTPTSTPTPTPVPAGTYASAFDFGVDHRWGAAQFDMQTNTAADSSKSYSVFENRDEKYTSISYIAADQRIYIFIGGATISFTAAELIENDESHRRYRTAGAAGTLTITKPSEEIRYVNRTGRTFQGPVPGLGVGNATTMNNERYLTGELTAVAELPTTGSYNYMALLDTTPATADNSSGYSGSGALTVNFGTGVVTGTIAARAVGLPDQTFTLVGTITPITNTYSGQISNSGGTFTGSFFGHLFGPGAVEEGLLISLKRSDGFALVGDLVGRR